MTTTEPHCVVARGYYYCSSEIKECRLQDGVRLFVSVFPDQLGQLPTVLTGRRHLDDSRPVEVHVSERVRQLLYAVRTEFRVVADHGEVGGIDNQIWV